MFIHRLARPSGVIVCHLFGRHYRELIAYGGSGPTPGASARSARMAGTSRVRPNAIIDAEFEPALADPIRREGSPN